MNEETKRILEMVAQGKITVDEGAQLLSAMEPPKPEAPAEEQQRVWGWRIKGDQPKEKAGPLPRFLRMDVLKSLEDGHIRKEVTIRIPVALIKSGVRLGAVFPKMFGEKLRQKLRDEGVDLGLTNLNPETVDELVRNMGQMTIDVEKGKAQVRFTAEA